ncbi:alpha/beta fold hydrolase [Nocardioides humilatus]|uniref:Alpha/beta fold hydrolase n=1 Tax=Nocardioides humilatus TaxID=2607660 RepID=A0A5B1LGH4_9ACTN|nr:alpha/beta hydrolase [Nocardioides humilatus]KAA1419298.1 alpha/beta fold hydrolase [Nocardioides humilatus]
MKPTRNRWIRLGHRGVWALRPLGRRVPGQWEPTLPPSTRLTLPGRGEVSVRVAPGPPGSSTVLLLHGVTWSCDINYACVLQELAEQHTVIAADHRGHGGGLPATGRFTMGDLADDAVAVLDALDVESAIVVGFSLGSLTALHLAVRHPERVDGLVLTAGGLALRSSRLERLMMHLPGIVFGLLGRSRLGRSVGARYFGLNRRDPVFRERWPWLRAELERNQAGAIAGSLRAAVKHDLRGQVDALRSLPTTVVVHEHDLALPTFLQREMAVELEADVVSIATDHEAPLSHPEVYRDAVLEAVANVEGRAFPRTAAAG